MYIINSVSSTRTTKSFGLRRLIMPFAFALLVFNTACHHHHDNDNENNQTVSPSGSGPLSATVVNLVADTAGFGAQRIDTNLVNGWGIALNPMNNVFWVNSNGAGKSVVYDNNGNSPAVPIGIPLGGMQFGGAPSGIVYNTTTGFTIPSQGPSKYIFVTEDGTILAWTSGGSAVTMVDNSASGAVYKGVTMASSSGVNYIYVANFNANKVEVYDQNFGKVSSMQFMDTNIPAGYAPFNVANIDGNIYVAYAKQDAQKHDDVKGAGFGYVSVFSPNGTFIKRLVSQGALNSPWAMVKVPNGFGGLGGAILVGNFGDGHITIYDMNGGFQGQIANNNAAIKIDGLWGLQFGPAGSENKLYFAAGPDDENHGLFGYITVSGGSLTSGITGGTGGTGGGGGTGGTGGGGGTGGTGGGGGTGGTGGGGY